MLNALNKPTPPAVAEGENPLPPPTYWALADLAGVKAGSIGESWVNANLNVEWVKALKVVQDESEVAMENEAGMKNRVGGFAESLRKLYLLVVANVKRFTVRSISHDRLATTKCEGRAQDLELQQ